MRLRGIATPDKHFPYQDNRALKITLQAMDLYQPDLIVDLGDLLDFYQISTYDKDPTRTTSLQDDIDEAADFLSGVSAYHPKAKRVLLEGNHEHRLTKYINRNGPALASLRDLDLPAMLGCGSRGWQFVRQNEFHTAGPLWFTHGEFAGLNATKKHLETYGVSLIYGHTHRIRHWSQRRADGGIIETWEAGCLCDMHAEYAKHTNWTHGFLTFEIDGDNFWVTPHRITPDYKLRFYGEKLACSAKSARKLF